MTYHSEIGRRRGSWGKCSEVEWFSEVQNGILEVRRKIERESIELERVETRQT